MCKVNTKIYLWFLCTISSNVYCIIYIVDNKAKKSVSFYEQVVYKENTIMNTQMYETLKKRIVKGFYEPGVLLREADLAEEFNASRTPVREVLQALERDRLINLLPYRGAQVSFINLDLLMQAMAVKINLEEMAARLAANNIRDKDIAKLEEIAHQIKNLDPVEHFDKYLELDTKFHQIVREASGNEVICEYLYMLQNHVERYYYYSRDAAISSMGGFNEEFTDIIESLKNHDPDAAGKAVKAHMDTFYDVINAKIFSGVLA